MALHSRRTTTFCKGCFDLLHSSFDFGLPVAQYSRCSCTSLRVFFLPSDRFESDVILFISVQSFLNSCTSKERISCTGKGREGKGREGKGREGKGREGKGREGKGREGKGREGKGREGSPVPYTWKLSEACG